MRMVNTPPVQFLPDMTSEAHRRVCITADTFLFWCGTRRTVCFGETRFSGRLEFVGKFGVPQLVTINKSASYGVQWNRTRIQQLSGYLCNLYARRSTSTM